MPQAASEDAGPVQMRLLVILGSHYCERARWALDLAGLAYKQDVYPPVVHMPGTRSARPRGSASTSVPMLLTPDEGVLTDSGDIVRYAWTHAGGSAAAQALYPADPEARAEVEAVEKEATRLGVWVRIVLYHYMFQSAPREAIIETLCQGTTNSREGWFRWLYTPITFLMKQGMRINEDNADKCYDRIKATMDKMSDRLATSKFLVGDSFTAADLTFSAMAALLVQTKACQDNYGAKTSLLGEVMPEALLKEMRESRAGQHCTNMYDLYRQPRESDSKL